MARQIRRQRRKTLRKYHDFALSTHQKCLTNGFAHRLLVDAFNPIQSARYDMFKRAKLKKETLRRIVNHALSQSVPASVVTTVNGFTKVFAGEIVEKARIVQAEWAEAHDREALA